MERTSQDFAILTILAHWRRCGKEGESTNDLLKCRTKDMSKGEVHRDFLKAAEAQPRKRPSEAPKKQ